MSDQKLDQLKMKYQGAINFMKQAGVRLTHVHVQDDKLFIQGEAPSQEVKNRSWDQIKLIDPSYSDLTADLSVNPSLAPSAGTQAQSSGVGNQTYTVKSGDTLSKISKQYYGDANQYMKIFEANRDQLSDPNKIQVGQKLNIPGASVGVS
ncbi:MAG TPA: LysM peptidoglycan-binding domain-containing protein [Bryobacteraceae bacterium]|nr:LysM peptidoglycan-binding domain-containing protein [Bryobacteraceae bacterium]